MKTLRLSLVLALSWLLFSTHAFAQSSEDIETDPVEDIETDPVNYVGIEVVIPSLDYNKTDTIDYSDYYKILPTGGRFYFGRRGKHFGVEVGILSLVGTRKNVPGISADSDFRLNSFTWDALFYYPINDLELVGSLGFATTYAKDQTTEKSSNTLIKNIDKTDILQPRIGLGTQYDISENIKIRTMLHWQSLNTADVFNHLISFNFGLNYAF